MLTYGTIVAQLCKDFDGDYVEVNKQLDKMGYNIGLRLIEDYLAKSNTMKRCANFRETAEMISKVRTTLERLLRYLHSNGDATGHGLTEVLLLGRLQDLPQHNAHHNELDERQQAVLAGLRGEPPRRLCRAARRRPRAGRALVLQHLLRCAEGRAGDGADAGRGAFHQRRVEGQ